MRELLTFRMSHRKRNRVVNLFISHRPASATVAFRQGVCRKTMESRKRPMRVVGRKPNGKCQHEIKNHTRCLQPRVGHGHHVTSRGARNPALADFGWIKCGHRLELVGYEPGNRSATKWTRRCRNGDNSLPVCDCGKIVAVANSCSWKVHDCGLAADNP
jgi:hypothetical protein